MYEFPDWNRKTTMATELKPGWRKWWREWIKPFLAVAVVLGSFRSSIADWNVVPTGSMKPTILEGDRIFVNKLAYDLRVPFAGWQLVAWSGPQRGEVVVFDAPVDGIRMVKRVVGLPGDQIRVDDDQLWINDRPADYEPLDPAIIDQIPQDQQGEHHFAAEHIGAQAHPVMTTPGWAVPRFYGPVQVPPGQYFMMGDNRDNSRDSRSYGFVPRTAIVGRATGVVISLDPDHSYQPRWQRFFRSMD
jgi:signal peptidase I